MTNMAQLALFKKYNIEANGIPFSSCTITKVRNIAQLALFQKHNTDANGIVFSSCTISKVDKYSSAGYVVETYLIYILKKKSRMSLISMDEGIPLLLLNGILTTTELHQVGTKPTVRLPGRT
ncbi:hypothetical protein J6590_062766 [Homalodisca vitripennis]|nr:hypothetical protein J6590_062766 [Homalodisca vitripennis]